MWMYSERDVKNIIEDFLAMHFKFGSVYLDDSSKEELTMICCNYGIEVPNIVEQY